MVLIRCSSFLQSALCQSSPASTCSFPSHRKVVRKKRASAIASVWSRGRSVDDCHTFHRRLVLLVGISVLPLLQLREATAGELEEAIDVVCHTGGFANIFLSQRKCRKNANLRSTRVVDNPAFEEKMGMVIQDSQGTKLKESAVDSLDSRVFKKEIGDEEARETDLKMEAEGPRATEHDFEAQSPMISESEIPLPQPKLSYEEIQETTGGSSFVSILNEIGIIGSGVLGALLATSQREKKDLESTIESMKSQRKEQVMAANLLEESYKSRLLSKHEKYQSQLKNLNYEKSSLSSELNSAKDIVAALGRDIQNEKILTEELKAQKSQLEDSFRQSREDKKLLEAALREKVDEVAVLQDKLNLLLLEINEKEKNIRSLNSLLAESESEGKNLSSALEQVKVDYAAANSRIEQLKEDINKARDASNSRSSIIEDLHAKIKSITEEKDHFNRKFYDLAKDYDSLISDTERSAALNSELMSKKDEQLQQLAEDLKHALNEVSCKDITISELIKERDNVTAFLKKAKNEVCKLTNEVESSRELLGTSSIEVSRLSKELMEAKTVNEEVTCKLLNLQEEYDQATQVLKSDLEDSKATSNILLDKLQSANAVLCTTEKEHFSASNELKIVMEEQEGLKKELVDAYQRVEATTDQLKEERKIVASLNKDLEGLHEQMLKDSESRKSLEADLDEATQSLDEMNRSALLLSGALENATSRSCSLETEKEILYRSLIEQKKIAKESHENMDDAKNFIARLGGEKERLEKRCKRFEEELAAAKGEILRLRRKISIGQEESMTQLHVKSDEVPAGTPFAPKRNAARRKKRSPDSADSV